MAEIKPILGVPGMPNNKPVQEGFKLADLMAREARSFVRAHSNEGIRARLHSIETMGLLDGPGVRTVFFLQGCPLRCAYCHNPDSQAWNAGQVVSVNDVVEKAKRYRSYHGKEGGVTFSGGEPLVQGEFLLECCKRLKAEKISIAIDTSGFGDPRFYKEIFPNVDVMLLDIKAFDENNMNNLIRGRLAIFNDFVANIEKNGFRGEIWLRHVMLPGYTDNEAAMHRFLRIAEPIWHLIGKIEILPYHVMGKSKYVELGRQYMLDGMPAMNKNRAKELERYANHLLAHHLRLKRKERKEDIIMYSQQKSEKRYFNDKQKMDIKNELRNMPLLADLEEHDFEEVFAYINIFKIDKGNYIFKSGDAADVMYLIKRGHVKISENTADGREQIYYIYNEGDFVGAFNLMYHKYYLYMGLATDDCEIVTLPKPVFECYMHQNPKILNRLLEMSFARIRWAKDLIQRLSTNNAAMKVAALLVRLTELFGVRSPEGIRLDLSINREEMGNYAGLTRETITRKLGEFKDIGYIEFIGNKVIVIKDSKL